MVCNLGVEATECLKVLGVCARKDDEISLQRGGCACPMRTRPRTCSEPLHQPEVGLRLYGESGGLMRTRACSGVARGFCMSRWCGFANEE